MERCNLASAFPIVEAAIRHAADRVPSLPTRNPVAIRFYSFAQALGEFKMSCEGYDADCQRSAASQKQISSLLLSDVPREATAEENEIAREYVSLVPKLRFDIRCIYIFAKIAFVSHSDLLFKLARNPSSDWRKARNFMRHLKNAEAGCLLSDFSIRFKDHLDWFQAQVNFYRDDFIEHQIAPPMMPGLLTDGRGHRITGLTGAGFASRDQELITTLRADLKDTFPEASTMDRSTFYEWMCRNLQILPERSRGDVKSMIHRVGRESGDIQEVVQGLVEMFVGFLSFCSEALGKNPLNNAVSDTKLASQ